MFGSAPSTYEVRGDDVVKLKSMKYRKDENDFVIKCSCGSIKSVCAEDLFEGAESAMCDSCCRVVALKIDVVRKTNVHFVVLEECIETTFTIFSLSHVYEPSLSSFRAEKCARVRRSVRRSSSSSQDGLESPIKRNTNRRERRNERDRSTCLRIA